MRFTSATDRTGDRLVSYFWSGETLRSRSVSEVVLKGVLDVPAPPRWLLAAWQREVSSRLELQPGDVEALPLAPARSRWPDYKRCVQAVTDWSRDNALDDVVATSDVALMASRGAKYHHDGEHYGGMAFCNLFLSDVIGQDLHFPRSGLRIPLVRGTVVVFDTCHPHAVIARSTAGFDEGDFPADRDCTQVFLTWELPVENTPVAQALRIDFDIDPQIPSAVHEEQVWLNGARASVCPDSGCWRTNLDLDGQRHALWIGELS
jgi:hypothetical protein